MHLLCWHFFSVSSPSKSKVWVWWMILLFYPNFFPIWLNISRETGQNMNISAEYPRLPERLVIYRDWDLWTAPHPCSYCVVVFIRKEENGHVCLRKLNLINPVVLFYASSIGWSLSASAIRGGHISEIQNCQILYKITSQWKCSWWGGNIHILSKAGVFLLCS